MGVMFAISSLLLVGGTEAFARGVEKLGGPRRFRTLLIGAGFALPTLLVAFVAGFGSYPKLAVAVLLGGLIANVGLVLSLSTLARPVQAKNEQLRRAIPLLITGTLLAWFLARDHELSRVDGALLLVAGVACAVLLLRVPFVESAASEARPARALGIPLVIAGLGWAVGATLYLVKVCSAENGLIRESGIGGTAFAFTVLAPVLALRGIAAGVVAARTGPSDVPLAGAVVGSLIILFLGFGVLALVEPLIVIESVLMNGFPAAAIAPLFLLAVRFNDLTTRRVDALLQLAAFLGFLMWMLRLPR